MSLDIDLVDPTATYDVCSLWSGNITHNLNKMAMEAGFYDAMWRPEQLFDNPKAEQIVDKIYEGLKELKSRPEHYKQFNSDNGWGLYEHFVPFVEEYLERLMEYPKAKIEVSR